MFPNKKHNVVGIRPGEKLHEEMISEIDCFQHILIKDIIK